MADNREDLLHVSVATLRLAVRSSFLSLYLPMRTSLTAKTIYRVIPAQSTIHGNLYLRMALSTSMPVPFSLVRNLTSGF